MRSRPEPGAGLATLAIALGASSCAVPQASAHEIVPGVSGLVSVMLHPFVTVDTVLVMVGLALVVGAARSRPAVPAGIASVLAGALAGVVIQPWALTVPGLWRWPLVVSVVLGALAAWGVSIGARALLMIGFLASLVVGLGVPPERPGWSGNLEVAAAVSLAVLTTLLVVALPRAGLGRYGAVRVAGRVVGAWCVAIASLGLAIALR